MQHDVLLEALEQRMTMANVELNTDKVKNMELGCPKPDKVSTHSDEESTSDITSTTKKRNFACAEVSRTSVLRILLVGSLLAAASVCAIVSHSRLRDMEISLAVNQYESIANLALDGAEANMLRRLQGAGVMAQIMSFGFPDADTWPLVALDGYVEINRALVGII